MTRALAAPHAGQQGAPSLTREAAFGGLGLLVLGLVGYGATLGWHVSNLHNGLLALSFTGVGLYVVRAQPRHRVGHLFLAQGLAAGVMYFGRQYGLHPTPLPGASWLAWVSIWPVPLVMAAAGQAVMMFPTGQHLTSRWRTAARVMVALATVLALASALWPIEDDWNNPALTFPFRLGGQDAARTVFWPLMLTCYTGFQLLWAAAVVARLRRAGSVEADQLRWFVSAVAVTVLLLLLGGILWDTPLLGLLALPLVPVTAGLTIVRHRLYDIQPVINKTLVVGAMVLLIFAGYVSVVVGIGALIPVSDPVLALAATTAVAVAFEPARRRVQALADRWVRGHRSTPYETLSRLSAQLSGTDEDLLGGLAAAIAGGVGASAVAVWVGDPDRMQLAAGWPARELAAQPCAIAEIGAAGDLVRPALQGGQVRGALVLRRPPGAPLTPSEQQLLADLVAQAGLVIDHQARLDQVARQAGELRAAARRIVTAEDAARRRIERDLHDGAQRRLVALGMELGLLADRATVMGDAELVRRAEGSRRLLLDATAELRAMARGVHPAVLTQDGLEAALANLTDRSPVPVALHVTLDRRLPAEVEATAYFLVSEAITNAARHARAGTVDVTAQYADGRLTVAVSDDGIGGADAVAGSGLQGLADRLAALGARLDVDSPVSGGTTLRTVLECG
ncbi:MAG: sensor histidine kinase [Kineosporiaceae bacterium]